MRTSHAAIDRILSTLLVEIDGVENKIENINRTDNVVIVIATTTCPPTFFDRYESDRLLIKAWLIR
jgi:SpoVK/Ycf46/Vps4 family AAA+-type ATPase